MASLSYFETYHAAAAAADAHEPVIVTLPAIIKAITREDGRRTIEVCASVETVDLEGDVIDQKALLDAAAEFVKTGHIDIDHISELGARYGVRNPESYIVGRPLEVKAGANKTTDVIAEIFRSPDGSVDIAKNKYDSVWESIKTGVRWRASIYGLPTDDGVEDCRGKSCSSGARRYHIKALNWRSLALTRNPICDAITGHAKIITGKAFAKSMGWGEELLVKNAASNVAPWQLYLAQTMPPPRVPAQSNTSNTNANNRPAGMGVVPPSGSITAPTIATAQSGAPGLPASTGEHEPVYPQETFMTESGGDPQQSQQPQEANPMGNVVQGFAPGPSAGFSGVISCSLPRDLSDAVGQFHSHMRSACPHCDGIKSTVGFKNHFASCCGMPESMADLFAHALMHRLLLDGRRTR